MKKNMSPNEEKIWSKFVDIVDGVLEGLVLKESFDFSDISDCEEKDLLNELYVILENVRDEIEASIRNVQKLIK